MTTADIKKALLALTDKERSKLLPGFREEDFQHLMEMDDAEIAKELQKRMSPNGAVQTELSAEEPRWFDRKISGLSKEGRKQLKELQEQLHGADLAVFVD